MYTRQTDRTLIPANGAQYYNLAGCARAYVFIINLSGVASLYQLSADYSGINDGFTTAIAIAAGASARLTLPNDTLAPPLPLPDVLLISAGAGALTVIVSRDR